MDNEILEPNTHKQLKWHCIPITQLQRNYGKIIKHINEEGCAIMLTKYHDWRAIIIDPTRWLEYQQLLDEKAKACAKPENKVL